MTTTEVRKILGPPKAVESGFPKSKDLIINEIPDLVGQLNASTWFYFCDKIQKVEFVAPGITYSINDINTTKELFNMYKNMDKIYFLKTKNDIFALPDIIDFSMVKGYRFTKNASLDSAIIDKEKIVERKHNGLTITKTYLPIFCVVFEKGTLVVAGTKIFYKLLSEVKKDGID